MIDLLEGIELVGDRGNYEFKFPNGSSQKASMTSVLLWCLLHKVDAKDVVAPDLDQAVDHQIDVKKLKPGIFKCVGKQTGKEGSASIYSEDKNSVFWLKELGAGKVSQMGEGTNPVLRNNHGGETIIYMNDVLVSTDDQLILMAYPLFEKAFNFE